MVVKISLLFIFLGCSSQEMHHHHKHDFSDAKAWSKKFDDPKRDQWQRPDYLMKIMNIKKGDHIADIGAGTGYLLSYLSKEVGSTGKVYALDVEKSLIEFMKHRIHKNNLRNITASLIPFDSPGRNIHSIDKVILLNTWHHISNSKEYAKNLYDGLKDKSSVFIIEQEKGAGGPGPKDKHRQVYAETAKDFLEAGFNCKQLDEDLVYQYIAICEKS